MSVLLDINDPLNVGRAPIFDMSLGGQNGAMMVPTEINQNSSYAKQRLIAVPLHMPRAIKYLPNSKKVLSTLISLMTVWPEKIDGLNYTLSLEFDERRIGNAGQMFHTVTGAKREPSRISYSWKDTQNAGISRFWNYLTEMLIMSPELGAPGVCFTDAYLDAGSPVYLPEDKSMTMLYIEPDDTLTRPVWAWIETNMMPRSAGEITGVREVHYTADVPEVPIEFTSTGMPMSKEVFTQATNYLKSLRLQGLRPTESRAFVEGPAANVDSTLADYRAKIDAAVGAL